MDEFSQSPPILGNQYDEDLILRTFINRKIPANFLTEIETDLHQMGHRVVTDIKQLGEMAEASKPRHVLYDPWGNRIDRIEVSDAWKTLDQIAAEEGLIAIAYQRKYGEFSRLYQFAKLYLFHPSSAIYTCPLAMTDGAARAIELYGDEKMKERAFQRLISTDPKHFWTSGQWMTEKTGGSDVSETSTVARFENGQYHLYGTKWFTSATTSQMAMTLARIEGAPAGSKGLSLFYLELRDNEDKLNHIQINRLKDKLGTHALPTAELTLKGVPALLVGSEGNGVKKISSLFNITRIYNACSALGYMRRGIALARSYAEKRRSFGRFLSDHPLHVETLANLQLEFEGAFHLTFHTVELLGKEETGRATIAEKMTLRLLTPLVKLYTAKQAIAISSEVLEAFGGAGYVEDTGLPHLLRDSQVLSIWEGTTNVLSLDVLRAIRRENTAEPFIEDVISRLATIQNPELNMPVEKVRVACAVLKKHISFIESNTDVEQERMMRQLAFSLARVYAGSLLIEHADWCSKSQHSSKQRAVVSAIQWCSRELLSMNNINSSYAASKMLALDRNYP